MMSNHLMTFSLFFHEWLSECYNQKKLVDIEIYLMHAGKPIWRRSNVPHEAKNGNTNLYKFFIPFCLYHFDLNLLLVVMNVLNILHMHPGLAVKTDFMNKKGALVGV